MCGDRAKVHTRHVWFAHGDVNIAESELTIQACTWHERAESDSTELLSMQTLEETVALTLLLSVQSGSPLYRRLLPHSSHSHHAIITDRRKHGGVLAVITEASWPEAGTIHTPFVSSLTRTRSQGGAAYLR